VVSKQGVKIFLAGWACVSVSFIAWLLAASDAHAVVGGAALPILAVSRAASDVDDRADIKQRDKRLLKHAPAKGPLPGGPEFKPPVKRVVTPCEASKNALPGCK
jgi:parvulin-like peptidyl-prolyl isomerase